MCYVIRISDIEQSLNALQGQSNCVLQDILIIYLNLSDRFYMHFLINMNIHIHEKELIIQ